MSQQRIQELENVITQWEQQKTEGISLQTQEQIDRDIKAAREEIADLQEQQEREIHTQEVNETNSDIAISVFDALIPDTKVFESMMGLTEFSDWRSGFYQLFDGALADRTKLMDDKHAYELAQKDEKIRLLSGQGMELQRQLDEARNMIVVQRENYEGYKADHEDFIDELKSNLEKAERQLSESKDQIEKGNAAIAENCELRRQITELEEKLEAAQKPNEEAKPSQSFTDRMHEIKSKNEARIKSAAELALENSAPFRGKVEISLPEIKQQERPFQGESGNDTPSNNSNDQLPSAQVDETVGPQFPSAPNVGTVHAPDLATGNVSGQQARSEVAAGQGTDGETPVTRAEFETRLTQFREEFKYELMQHYRVGVTQ